MPGAPQNGSGARKREPGGPIDYTLAMSQQVPPTVHVRHGELCEIVAHHNRLYYVEGHKEIQRH